MAQPKQLDIIECYRLAWKSFAKWWIPLCVISASIMAIRWGPKLVSGGGSVTPMLKGTLAVFQAMGRGDQALAEAHARQVREDVQAFARNLLRVTGVALPFVAILWSVLMLYANRAVKDKKKKQPISRVLLVAVWRMALAAFKLLPLLLGAILSVVIAGVLAARQAPALTWRLHHLALFLLLFLVWVFVTTAWFFYTYTKLLFVPLVMFDGETGGWAACKQSWQQTDGRFLELLLIIILNAFVQATLAITIIGAIPGLSFVETVRAAAFRMTLPEGEGDAKDAEPGPTEEEGDLPEEQAG